MISMQFHLPCVKYTFFRFYFVKGFFTYFTNLNSLFWDSYVDFFHEYMFSRAFMISSLISLGVDFFGIHVQFIDSRIMDCFLRVADIFTPSITSLSSSALLIVAAILLAYFIFNLPFPAVLFPRIELCQLCNYSLYILQFFRYRPHLKPFFAMLKMWAPVNALGDRKVLNSFIFFKFVVFYAFCHISSK